MDHILRYPVCDIWYNINSILSIFPILQIPIFCLKFVDLGWLFGACWSVVCIGLDWDLQLTASYQVWLQSVLRCLCTVCTRSESTLKRRIVIEAWCPSQGWCEALLHWLASASIERWMAYTKVACKSLRAWRSTMLRRPSHNWDNKRQKAL